MNEIDLIVSLAMDSKEYADDLTKSTKATSKWAVSLGTAVSGGMAVALVAVSKLMTGIFDLGKAAVGVSGDIKQSQNDLVAGLGLTKEAAKELSDVAVNVFRNNFAGSIEEATAAVAEARRQLGDLSDKELQDATENAFRLSDVFGVDVTESLSAARSLTEEFGISQQEAFDLITSGFQRGLNSSGDFLDSIGEYSNLFAENGVEANEMFSILDTGLAGGALGTDKAADLFKEFGIRIKETGDFTGDLIGDYNRLTKELFAIEDPVARNARGLELFGTQWEDLGESAVRAIDPMTTTMEDLAGSTDKLNAKYDNFGAVWEGIKRNALLALVPIGDKLFDLAGKAMPFVEQAFSFFETALPPIIEQATAIFDDLFDALQWLIQGKGANVDWLSDIVEQTLSLFGVELTNDQFTAIMDSVWAFWDTLISVRDWVVNTLIPSFMEFGTWLIDEGVPAFLAFVTPIIEQVIPGLLLLGNLIGQYIQFWLPILVQWWKFLFDHMNIILPIIAAVGVVILALTSPISLVIAGIVLLATAWANNWGGIQEKTQAVLDFIMPFINSAMKFIQDTVVKVLKFVQNWWDAHGKNVMVIVKAMWNFILLIIDTQLKFIWGIIQVVLAVIQQFWDDWGQTLMLLASLVWDNITTIVSAAMDLIGFIIDAVAAVIQRDWDAFGEALKNIWSTAWEAIKTILTNAKKGLIAIIGTIKDKITEKWDEFVGNLKDKWDTMWSGLGAVVDTAVGSIKRAFQPIIDLIDGMITKVKELLALIPTIPGLGDESSSFTASAISGRSGGDTFNDFTQINNFGDSGGFDSTGQFAQTQALNTT